MRMVREREYAEGAQTSKDSSELIWSGAGGTRWRLSCSRTDWRGSRFCHAYFHELSRGRWTKTVHVEKMVEFSGTYFKRGSSRPLYRLGEVDNL